MSETLIQVIADILILLIIPFVIFCVVNIVTMRTDLKWIMKFIHISGESTFMSMHSPNNHHGLDEYIDKYTANHGDLSLGDWIKVKDLCIKASTSDNKHPEDQSKSRMIIEFANHKIDFLNSNNFPRRDRFPHRD